MNPASVKARLRPLLAQAQDNPRLQAGLALIALLVVGWLALVLHDAREARIRELERQHQRLAQIKQLAGQKMWIERADEAERLGKVLAAELPEAKSAGLAQADFQAWLRPIVDAQNANLRLDVQAPTMPEDMPGVVQVTAVVSGGLPPQRVVQMLGRIEGYAKLVTVPVATIRDDGLNQTFSLTVRGLYRLPTAAGEQTP